MKFKILKKIVGIFGFKLIDKNLIKNERLVKENSFFSLNSIFKKLFFFKLIKNIIQKEGKARKGNYVPWWSIMVTESNWW